jgi:hypothetical protein
MRSKLKNRLQEYLPMIMGMYTQTFFELDNFPYNATYDYSKHDEKPCQPSQ